MESGDQKQVVLQVGAVLRRLRKENNMSLEDLSERSGVSKLTLGKIERGDTNPTLGMLWKISKSLSVPLMALFSSESNVKLSRAGEGLIIAEGESWVVEPIFQGSRNQFEMWRAYLQPNSSYHPENHHPNSTEMITVMSGSVTIYIDDDEYILNHYDSISFSAGGTHSYINYSDEVAVLHITLIYRM